MISSNFILNLSDSSRVTATTDDGYLSRFNSIFYRMMIFSKGYEIQSQLCLYLKDKWIINNNACVYFKSIANVFHEKRANFKTNEIWSLFMRA